MAQAPPKSCFKPDLAGLVSRPHRNVHQLLQRSIARPEHTSRPLPSVAGTPFKVLRTSHKFKAVIWPRLSCVPNLRDRCWRASPVAILHGTVAILHGSVRDTKSLASGTASGITVAILGKVDIWLPEKGNSNYRGARPICSLR